MDFSGIEINYLGHSGFLIVLKNGKKIAIDPYNLPDKISKVDFILITHGHYDHCSISDIKKLIGVNTTIICTADVQSKLMKLDSVNMQIIESGDEFNFKIFKIEAVPSYNIGKPFHLKNENWVGYLIKLEGLIIYHAGDTDKIPEMKKLTGYAKHGNQFVALLPVSGKYVMDFYEASEVAEILNVDMAIPMHYGEGVAGTIEDAENFVKLCSKKNIPSRRLDKLI